MDLDGFAARLSRDATDRPDAGPPRQRTVIQFDAAAIGLRCVQAALAVAAPSVVWAAAPQFPDASSQSQPGTRTTEITVTVDTLYDSNVARGDASIAAKRNLVPGDVRVQPLVSFDVLRPIGRQSLFLKGLAGYDFYRRDTILNRQRVDISGGLDARVGPCTGAVTADYAEHQSDLAELGAAVITKNIQYTKSISFNSDCAREIGFTPTFGVSQTDVTNSANQRFVSDLDTFALNGGVEYRNPALGNLSLFGQYESTRFPNRLPTGVATSYKVYTAGVQYDRRLGGRIEASAEVAFTTLRSDPSSASGFNGLTYDLSATASVSPRISIKLDAERATRPSILADSAFSRQDTYLGEVSYDANSRLKLTAGASALSHHYGGSVAGSKTNVLTDETITDVFATARFQITPRLSLVLDVRQEKRDANLPALRYVSNRVGISVTARF